MKNKITALLTLTFLIGGCTAVDSPSQESENESSDAVNTSSSYSDGTKTENSVQIDSSSPSAGSLTLKWGVNNLGDGFNQALVSDFNEALSKYGCDFVVEFVDLYEEQYFDFNTGSFDLRQSITDYEEKNDRLDIIDMAFSDGGIGIEGGQPEEGKKYSFISEGLLEPLDINAIMPDRPFPDKVWDMERVNGTAYTLPSRLILDPKILTFYLNTDYISQEKLDGYDGTFEGLVDILSALPEQGRFVCVLDMGQTYYETPCVSSEFDFVQSLVLDYQTKKAVNPFEHQLFLDFARIVNKAYNSGIITSNRNRDKNFSLYGGCFEYVEDKGEVVAFVSEGEMNEENIKSSFYTDPEKMKKFSSPKAYIKNNSSGNIGISASSNHKEQAVRLLNAVCNDPDCAEALQKLGIYRPLCITDMKTFEEEAVDSRLNLSPVAGYEIGYTEVETYSDIKAACYKFYDELCRAENFDSKLKEINNKLKEMGIDEFIDKVNSSLAESGHLPS